MPWKVPPQGLCTHELLLLFPLTSFMSLLKCSILMKYTLIVQFKMETKTKTLLAFPIPFPSFDLFLLDRLLTYHVIDLLFIFGLLQLTCEVFEEGVFSCFAWLMYLKYSGQCLTQSRHLMNINEWMMLHFSYNLSSNFLFNYLFPFNYWGISSSLFSKYCVEFYISAIVFYFQKPFLVF